MEPSAQIEDLDKVHLEQDFTGLLELSGLWPLWAGRVTTLQINLGRRCNMACRHCHVDAGPERTEVMSRATLETCLEVVAANPIATVDLTGGAPEIHPDFRWVIEQLRGLDRHVITRCNLTVLAQPEHRDLPAFFARLGVELVGSLPHYRQLLTDRQRGDGAFEKSLAALRLLNEVGYGVAGTSLRLVLVSNPVGALLPASQTSLEREWKQEMSRLHGVTFDVLHCITNVPIGRYLEWLQRTGNLESYLRLLGAAFNPAAAAAAMCRTMVSVGWDGRLHDCDFNQMLELGLDPDAPQHVSELDLAALEGRRIVVGRHCLSCTAGAGSSCGGATT